MNSDALVWSQFWWAAIGAIATGVAIGFGLGWSARGGAERSVRKELTQELLSRGRQPPVSSDVAKTTVYNVSDLLMAESPAAENRSRFGRLLHTLLGSLNQGREG